MGRFAFIVAYDGTRYQGFQIQRQGPTIQGELEAALHRLTGEVPRVVGAGRTDTGVHALGQVAACDLITPWDPADLERAMNAVLPPDIAVRQVAMVQAGFHPRFSARSRTYRYRIWNAPARLPTERLYSLHVPRPLDVAAMNSASQVLVGEHDFATFGSPVGRSRSTVRVLYRAAWSQDGPRIWFDIEANAFLRRMVRGLVGTLLLVGRQQRSPDIVAELLATRDRSRSGPSAPGHGLCLMQVTYPADLWVNSYLFDKPGT
ncbi:MAG: tRNA pseudouridine(38-40) synthase TruA [Chloroflexi bacterium]|nr:tRNA pseudouridine(38-40) synthase TruA [Chloroflexota bacterium]MBU1750890.1 tRNA pseudouridine(38-40) synthase TruA [Chloroflexota bacterium]MBU1879477.1 tRNA pseudouridine(38-40) synthase TruA [Chloroflexota bacterium]